MKHFHIGNYVRLSTIAQENETYDHLQNHILRVTGWCDHYNRDSWTTHDTHGHPGYDEESAGGDYLYSLYDTTTQQDCGNSLYDYELEAA